MNKKDREALDKFVDEDSLSPEDTKRFAEMSDGERATFIAERFFEAGAKYGRAELKEENKKLVEALKFYENCSVLMLKQRDLPIDPIVGMSVLTERHVQDNGDVARQVLKEIGENNAAPLLGR